MCSNLKTNYVFVLNLAIVCDGHMPLLYVLTILIFPWKFVRVNNLSLNLRALQTFLSEWYYTNFKNNSQLLITTA